nr:uncharacterized protein LOC129254973 [Lytechinus pictus]
MSQEITREVDEDHEKENEQFKHSERLGKKLTYLLRYGAKQEGLSVCPQGYVKLNDLVQVSLLRWYKTEEVLQEIQSSKSFNGKRRYEDKKEKNTVYVRASYNRRFERNPYHEETKVPRLLESCMQYICTNIKDYSLEDCPDEFLVNELLHRLKRKGKLTNVALENLLGPYIETLNLEGALITQKAPKIITQQCPNLRNLNLKDCGYVITDHVLTFLMKRLPDLRVLNLSNCNHLTGKSLRTIPKHLPHLQILNLTWVKSVSESDLLAIIEGCYNLEKIMFFAVKLSLSDEACIRIAKVCGERPLKVMYDNNSVS